MASSVILTGFMGVGKTATGRIYGSRRSLHASVERRVDSEGKDPDAVAREMIMRYLGETGEGRPA